MRELTGFLLVAVESRLPHHRIAFECIKNPGAVESFRVLCSTLESLYSRSWVVELDNGTIWVRAFDRVSELM